MTKTDDTLLEIHGSPRTVALDSYVLHTGGCVTGPPSDDSFHPTSAVPGIAAPETLQLPLEAGGRGRAARPRSLPPACRGRATLLDRDGIAVLPSPITIPRGSDIEPGPAVG